MAGGFGTPGFVGEIGPTLSTSNALSAVKNLKTHWSPESDPPSLPVPLSQEVREDLSWWMMRDHLLMGVRFGSAPVFGHISVGMEHTPPRSVCVRGVVGGGDVAALQSS